jgi:hypothetical protein
LIALVSEAPGTRELKELSLAINTPDGIVLVVGCSHPGIDKIIEAAANINPKIHLVAGGFHLVVASDDAISKIVATLKDIFKVENIAPGHCTGKPSEIATYMQASARRSKSDRERLPGNDAAKHRRSIRTISSAIAGWLLVKIRLGSLYGVGDSPIKSSSAQADVPPMSAFGP